MYKTNQNTVFVEGVLFRATEGSSGYDLLYVGEDTVVLHKGQRALLKTGVRLVLPEGMEAQVRSRSGLALKHGLAVLNSPGTIDSDYRGEIGVILVNHGDDSFPVTPGLRIAQLVFARVDHPDMLPLLVERDNTERGEGGFGSTGE